MSEKLALEFVQTHGAEDALGDEKLALEFVQTHGAEDALGEELLDEAE